MRSLSAITLPFLAACSLFAVLPAYGSALAFNAAPPDSATLFEVRTVGVIPPYGGNVALPIAFLNETEIWIGRFTLVSDDHLVMEVIDHRNTTPQFWLPPLLVGKSSPDFMMPPVVIPYEKIRHISFATVPE